MQEINSNKDEFSARDNLSLNGTAKKSGFFRRRRNGGSIGYVLGSVIVFITAFALGIIFTIYMTTHSFNNGLIKDIQKPILTASGIPADAHPQWLDLEAAFANIDHFYYSQDKVDHKKMIYTAAEAAVHTLGDPFTLFRQPEQARNDAQDLNARRTGGGIGIYTAIRDGKLLVSQLVPGNPAEKAGLREGDIISKADGNPIVISGDTAKDLDNASKILRGEIGTLVKLEIIRPAENNRVFEVTITRADVTIPPVITRIIGENKDVGYISVTTFGGDTVKQFDEKVAELEKSNPTSYVLDLRNNPGGLVPEAQKLLGRFLDGGVAFYRDVPYQNSRNQPENVINETSGVKLFNKPLAVLINGGTASASEITAGALQDRGRAALIGEKSFGKGVAQYVIGLPGNSSVRVTFEQWFTPNKTNLGETKGLLPNIGVTLKQEDVWTGRDPQLDRALQFLQNKEVVPPVPATGEKN